MQSFCIFFVTPSFAQWLQDETFLQNALTRLYHQLWNTTSQAKPEIQALCAVVDKLPIARAFDTSKSLADRVRQRTVEPPVTEIGSEGIAYVTLPSSASISSTMPHPADTGFLDFVSNDFTSDQHCRRHEVRLPLANTIFQTGTPTTMTFSTWRPTSERDRLELLSKSNISHHGIQITGHHLGPEYVESALSIPLLPVTEPRHVAGCMGNIVRRLVDAEGKSVTASSELEDVVPRFFRSRSQPPQATTAWALVIPESISNRIRDSTKELLAKALTKMEERDVGKDRLWEYLWQSNPPSWNSLVPTALAEGARLHRILSGGGGWGKKAGLIALDPTPNIRDEHQISEIESSSLPRDLEDFRSALTPIIQNGDSVQFFLCPTTTSDLEGEQSSGIERLLETSEKNTWNWELGTIPSTVDSMPSISSQNTSPTSKNISVFQNTFGALTERGLTITRDFPKKEENTSAWTSSTVVDVPFSRFSALQVSNLSNSNGDVGEPEDVQ